MSDNNHDGTIGVSDPFYYDDVVTQRAMAFFHIAKMSDGIKDPAIKDLCLTMLKKLSTSMKLPSTAEVRSIEGGHMKGQ